MRFLEGVDSPARAGARLSPTLALVLAVAVAGCRGQATTPAADGRSAVSQPTGAQAPLVPTTPREQTFQRVDLLIAQWDAAQGQGATEQTQSVFDRVRQEVDAAYGDFAEAAKGTLGVRLQYLGVVALGFSTRPESTAILVERLSSEDARLVGNALLAIKMRADPDTPLGPILQRIPAGAPEPRRYAPLALANVLEARQRAGRPRDPATERMALNLLAGTVADRDPYVRLHTAKALGFLPLPGTYPLVQVLISDEHARIRVAAAVALERLGEPRGFVDVLKLYVEAPEDTKPVVGEVLASYAAHLQGRPLTEAELKEYATSPAGWHRWYQEYARRTGLPTSPDAPVLAPPTVPPRTAPAPNIAPPAVSPPTVSPPTVSPPTVSPPTVSPPTVAPRIAPGSLAPPTISSPTVPPPPPPPTSR